MLSFKAGLLLVANGSVTIAMDSVLRAAVLQEALPTVRWTDEMHETFVDLATALISAPAIGLPDYNLLDYNLLDFIQPDYNRLDYNQPDYNLLDYNLLD